MASKDPWMTTFTSYAAGYNTIQKKGGKITKYRKTITALDNAGFILHYKYDLL